MSYCPLLGQSLGKGRWAGRFGECLGRSLGGGHQSYWPFGQTLQGKSGGVVGGLQVLGGMRRSVGLSSQTGIRQVAVRVQEWRIVLTVADVGKQQTDDPSDKGVCKRDQSSSVQRQVCCLITANVESEKQHPSQMSAKSSHFFLAWPGVFIKWVQFRSDGRITEEKQ